MEKYLSYKTEDFVLDESFREWAAGPGSEDPECFWPDFLADHPEKKKEIDEAILIVRKLNQENDPEIPDERIDLIWRKIMGQNKVRLFRYARLLKYAAILVLVFMLGAVSYYVFLAGKRDLSLVYNEITVPYGERTEMSLYDGTKVWLNSGTTMKFPLVFDSRCRQVFIDGEAFFDVKKKRDHQPFIVSTKAMTVTVAGTRFNVCAYSDDSGFSATLEEGKIIASSKINHKKIDLLPGHQAILNLKTNDFSVKKVDTELYTTWKENLLRFQDADFNEVVKKMERWYDVKIIVDPGFRLSKLFTMTIKTESLREMLKLLAYTTPMEYRIDKDNVYISKP